MTLITKVFKQFPTITIDTFLLRAIKDEDASDLYEMYRDEEVLRYEGMIPLHNMSEMKELKETIRKQYHERIALRWIIEDLRTHRAIGSIAMYYIRPWQRAVCMGYALHRDYWNQGIMTTCMKGLLKHLYHQYHVYHVLLTIWPENEASIALAQKLGFVYQGVLTNSGYDARLKRKVDMLAYSLSLPYMVKHGL